MGEDPVWDRTGYCILYKRFERHAFVVPKIAEGATHIELTAAQSLAPIPGGGCTTVGGGESAGASAGRGGDLGHFPADTERRRWLRRIPATRG